MRISFVGDIIGKPGREMLKKYLSSLKEKYKIDLVIANGENTSHGFGLSQKNANELLSYGVDFITGGNHIWDKKDIIPFLDTLPIIRPINYPPGTPGTGLRYATVGDEKLAIINLMGYFTMPMVENPFLYIQKVVNDLDAKGIRNIFIDFHAEATSEKATLLSMLKGKVSAICGTHTHVGTDDMVIDEGTFFVSDVGLTGCRDGIIGMDKKAPIQRFTTALSSSFDIPKSCKKIFQIIILKITNGKCIDAKKIKIYNDRDKMTITEVFKEY